MLRARFPDFDQICVAVGLLLASPSCFCKIARLSILFSEEKETALPPSNLNHSEDSGGIFAILGNPRLAEREGSLFGPRTQSWKLNLIDFWAQCREFGGPKLGANIGEFLDGPRMVRNGMKGLKN